MTIDEYIIKRAKKEPVFKKHYMKGMSKKEKETFLLKLRPTSKVKKIWAWIHKVDGTVALENVVTGGLMVYATKKEAIAAGELNMAYIAWELKEIEIHS